MAKRSSRTRTDAAELPVSGGVMDLLRAALIIGVGLWVYSPAFHGDWLWDDDWYITNNPLLRTGAGLWSFWFHPGVWVEYYPVQETFLWTEWHLFGTDTLGYHLITVALHLIDALLVWRLLGKLGLPKAWLGGLIFAVHPACVDSVAWIVETKNTLSLLPFLLAMCAWIDYEDRKAPLDYGRAFLLFLTAMLCKITVSPFPLLILLYAWWKRRRITGPDLFASGPFFAVSLGLGSLTLACGTWYFEHHEKLMNQVDIGGWPLRVALAGQSLAVYFAHCFWPVNLLPIYPRWTADPFSPLAFLPWLILAGVIFLLWQKRTGWGRHALLGLGTFLLFVAPFTGFVGASYMSSTWIMDHFLYIPIIGLIGLVVAALGSIEAQFPRARLALTGTVTAMVALLAIESHAYSSVYTDEATLWSYTLDHYPDSWLTHYNLANALFQSGEFPAAIGHYQQAVALNPDYAIAHNNLGIALVQVGNLTAAREQFEAALKIVPTYAGAQHNLAHVEALQQAGLPK